MAPLDEFYQRLADINSAGSQQTSYDQMYGARKRNNQSFYQQLANEKKKMLQFTVSTPHQNYQDQQINQQMGTSTGNFAYPLHGKLRMTSDYGPRAGHKTPHTGVDWAAPAGTPIYAPADATVRSTDYNKIYGNRTIIDYGGGKSSMLGHQSKYIVQPGQKVKAGQIIGYVGSTGNSTGPHLHFETWVNNNPVNPLSWFL